MAHITIFALYRIEAGELETCITIAMSYFVYLTCEAIEASGVIGVVLLGLTLNMNRACFSVSAIEISEQTWELLAYVANSLIFITVGVILLKTYSGSDKMLSLLSSIPQLLLIYIILILVRAIMILCIHFLLKQIAYGFTWKDSIVTIWSGLRGGVSLVLALTLFNTKIKDKYQAEIMLIHTTAIVFLTCTVNALTIPSIIHILRLNQTSELIKQTVIQMIKELKMKQNNMIKSLKKNQILATADWFFVQKAIDIQSPFDEKKDEIIKENLLLKRHIDTVKCDHCQAHVTIPISKFEFKQTFEDCRIRILRLVCKLCLIVAKTIYEKFLFRLQKTHFWSNYYNGQLSSYGLHTLNSLCDRAIDTPKAFIDLQTIKAHIIGKSRIRSLLNIIRNGTHKYQRYLPWYYCRNQHRLNTNNNIQSVQKWYRKLFISFLIILIECIILIYQVHTNLCHSLVNKFQLTLEIISTILFIFDCIQVFHWFYHNKQRKFYIINLIWIILYAFSVLCRLLSSIIYIIGIAKTSCVTFYILKSLSLIECIILCLFLIEPLRLFVDYMLNRYISVSYDIGLAYISSEEQVLRIIYRLTDNETIRIRIRELSLQHIKSVLNDVLIMQEAHPGTIISIKTYHTLNLLYNTAKREAHPGTIISIKTYHTLNLLYNTAKRGITQIRSRGVLDVDDCDLLEQSLQNMHIHLHIPSTMPPISPMISIKNLSWLYSNQQLNFHQINTIEKILIQTLPNENTKYFENESLLHPQSFTWQDFLWHKNDTINGIYLLVNGIVEEWKLDPYDIDAYHSELRWKENNRTRRTTLTTSQNQNYRTISNKNIGKPSNTNRTDSDITSDDESIVSTKTVVSTNVSEKDLVPLNTNIVSYNDDSTLTTPVRIAFEEGFYMRWHHFLTNSIDNKFNNNSIITKDSIHHIQSDENFEEYFDETFEKYRQIHPATSERIHRRYSLKSGDYIGLYDFLINNGGKYESTAKCLTNITVFFIAKEKLFEIFNTYSLWNVIWLEMSILQ
ncbi:unnamed protein product [Adineta steineri]|uniref:Cation/H+ exchanger transmembrane domain-containing protein n=1 Tax=Adineta steineri TaxID=433720 RepID=A0A814R4I8_9BILA|nr:unnamed protein product [Adineta steineri]